MDYRSNVNSYIPDGVINVEMKGYKQYNLESICMKAGHLVLAANVITGTGKAEDRFSVLNGITYEKGTKRSESIKAFVTVCIPGFFFCNACLCGQPEPAGCCCEFSDG